MTGIFLDRDGVIIRKAPDGEYITDSSGVEFLPGALEAIAKLRYRGFKVIVVTNQRGVATGKIRLANLDGIHSRLESAVASFGTNISAIYFCPHDTSDGCECRKPKPGMLLRAAAEHRLRLADCWMVGDSESDIAAGKSVGCRTGLVTVMQNFRRWANPPDLCGDSLRSIVDHIMQL